MTKKIGKFRPLFIGHRKVGHRSVNNDRSIRSNLIGYINLVHSKINGSGLNVMVLHAGLL